MFEGQAGFPKGSIRAAVAAGGDWWRLDALEQRGELRSDGMPVARAIPFLNEPINGLDAMKRAECVRQAGIKPGQRVLWDMRLAAIKCGEVL